jgi:hypothetical protein
MLSPHPRKPAIAHALVIRMAPLNRFRCYRTYLARLLVAGMRMPLLDAAGEPIRLAADPDAILVMRNAGASNDAMRGRLAHAAGLIIDEDRCRFRPVRGGETAPPVRQTPLAYAGGHASADGRAA